MLVAATPPIISRRPRPDPRNRSSRDRAFCVVSRFSCLRRRRRGDREVAAIMMPLGPWSPDGTMHLDVSDLIPRISRAAPPQAAIPNRFENPMRRRTRSRQTLAAAGLLEAATKCEDESAHCTIDNGPAGDDNKAGTAAEPPIHSPTARCAPSPSRAFALSASWDRAAARGSQFD
jgi:hypothetical protein